MAKRLGATIYFPYGMEWYEEGYYRLYGDLRKQDPVRWVAKKYLVDTYYGEGITLEREMGCLDYPLLNTLTLEQARNTEIDVVICSVNENQSSFAKLKEFYPRAKFVRQTGNDVDVFEINSDLYPNLLASAKGPYDVFNGNKVLYRQEFDLGLFVPSPSLVLNYITSFQNDIEQFEETWNTWLLLRHTLSDYSFKSFGAACDNGKIYQKKQFIEEMRRATFLFQSKGPWEGYGHVVHNAMCIGRPMILKGSDYVGKLAEPLLIKDETYLEMDDELPDKVRFYSDPRRHGRMVQKCQQVFRDNVDFDLEFARIATFFQELV